MINSKSPLFITIYFFLVFLTIISTIAAHEEQEMIRDPIMEEFQSQPLFEDGMVVPPEMIKVGEPFELHPGGRGALTATDGFTIFLTGIEKLICKRQESCPGFAAQLEVRMQKNNNPQILTLNKGANQIIGNYKITIIDIKDPIHQVKILIEKTSATPVEDDEDDLEVEHEFESGISRRIQITPGVPFKLQHGGTGFILGSDSVEFTITAIKLPHCTYPNGQDMHQLPHNDADMPMPTTCTSGTISVSIQGRSIEITQEKPFSLNDKYVLVVRGISGTETGQRTVELIVTKNIMPGDERDEHGCIASAGYIWCNSKNKCLRTWEEQCDNQPPTQPPQQILPPQSCQGCRVEEKCFFFGTRLPDTTLHEPAYCEINGTLTLQKKTDETCQNNYECQSNTCADGLCTSLNERLSGIEKEVREQRSILDLILGFFKRIFGME